MMNFGNISGWGMAFMWVGGLIMLGLFIWFIWFIVTFTGRTTYNNLPPRESAIDILKKRYARGEINKEEYDEMSKDFLY